MKRILTGLKPSGELTLGSYIGGIKGTIKRQEEYESFLFVPDMHAITVRQEHDLLKERIRKNVALYLACGVDPDKNIIYLQSENLYHANLSWVLECNTYMGEASRMTQYKDKSSKGENVTVGLFTYPILMASDILLYDADYVPVGIDQKQHVELARNIAERFNKNYIEISKWVMELNDDIIKNTIMHEIIHCFPYCNNHGKEFKKYAGYINTHLGYSVSRLGNKEEDYKKSNLEYDIPQTTPNYKYKIECQKCGKYFFRQRYNKNLTRHYRCGICGGKLKAVKVI